MNLQTIDRLKGLLARVERNASKPRVFADVQILQASPAQGLATPPPAIVQPKVTEAVTSSSPVNLAPDELEPIVSVAPVAPPVAVVPKAPALTAPEPKPALAATGLNDMPVDLSPPAPVVEAAAVKTPAVAEAAELEEAPLEDVSAEDIGLEDLSFEDIAAETSGQVSVPTQTAVQASPAPFTTPPSLDDLTFSEPPPPPVESAPPPASTRQVISEAPDSIDAALIAATAAQAESESEQDEREAPLLTPPPESGRQPARPSTATAAQEATRLSAPTVEQLGEVVELEELSGPVLELAEAAPPVLPQEPEELEFVPQVSTRSPDVAPATVSDVEPLLPPAREAMPTLVGAFVDELPPSSRELETAQEKPESAPPMRGVAVSVSDAFSDEAPTSVVVALSAETTQRRAVVASKPVVDVISQARSFKPQSFLELLDASLKLGK